MTPLQPPDLHHFNAAVGWLQLGNHLEANEELEQIEPRFRVHPDVLVLRWEVYAKLMRWDMAVEVAVALIELVPDDAFGYIHRSFALRRLNGIQAAWDKLLPVADKFKDNWIVPYNLACYACQLGNLEAAREWYKQAMAIDEKAVQRTAIDDPDLKPLWDSMGGSIWKRAE